MDQNSARHGDTQAPLMASMPNEGKAKGKGKKGGKAPSKKGKGGAASETHRCFHCQSLGEGTVTAQVTPCARVDGGKSLGRVKAVLGTAAKILKGGPNWCTNPYGLGSCEGQINLKV